MHGDTALLPPHIPSPLARFGQHDCPAMRRGLRSLHLLAGLGDLNRPVLRQLYHLSEIHADAMIDVTLVVLLSVHRELRSEYAELSFDIFCVLPHTFLSRLLDGQHPAARPHDSYILNGCRYRTILRRENDRWRRTQLHCFVACRRLLLRVLT